MQLGINNTLTVEPSCYSRQLFPQQTSPSQHTANYLLFPLPAQTKYSVTNFHTVFIWNLASLLLDE